jgi:hypothetical protein
MDIAKILTARFPGCFWTLNGNEYSGLDWQDDSKKPTEAELLALWPTVQAEEAHRLVEVARAEAYRETSDPLFFEWQRGDATEAEWLAAVEAVKTAHPYPGE